MKKTNLTKKELALVVAINKKQQAKKDFFKNFYAKQRLA